MVIMIIQKVICYIRGFKTKLVKIISIIVAAISFIAGVIGIYQFIIPKKSPEELFLLSLKKGNWIRVERVLKREIG
jgi:hypothetical protein